MIPFYNILFLDIETVPQHATYDSLPEASKPLWSKKAELLLRNRDDATVESIYDRAGIYAEFGKVICISCGVLCGNGNGKKLLLKSFYGEDEKQLLSEFCDMLSKWTMEGNKYLCAHNGKEFDFPFLCRRMIINDVCMPSILAISGKKPWEIHHLDTMEMWKFGDYKNYTSLNLLAHVLGVPTPKDDIDGSMVGHVFWTDRDISRIVHYCQKDVITVAQVYMRLNRESLIPPENIEIK
ncbi:MAG TPA: 3'-5' exonuclease [Flavitalea sp.]|nr:3'-5' exonuclease [Flavitalea sp.]